MPTSCLILHTCSIENGFEATVCYNGKRKIGYESILCIYNLASWLSLVLQLMFLPQCY